MSADAGPKQRKPRGGRRFQPGQSGNPAGRPKGLRHAALLVLDAIGTEAASDILKTVVTRAKSGDVRACELLLKRLWPERRGHPVTLNLPPVTGTQDIVTALAAITAAVASAEISPEEAGALAGVLEVQRRAVEQIDLVTRIEALEQKGKETSQ